MNRPHHSIAPTGLALASLLLVGCTHTPTPIFTDTGPITTQATTAATPYQIMCTPVVGDPSPKPCTQADYDKLRQQRIDYAAAEKVYRAFFAEDVKLMTSGDTATPEVRLLLAGPMVDRYAEEKSDQHKAGVTASGEFRLAYVRPSSVAPYSGSEIALDTCQDASSVNGIKNGQVVGRADSVRGHAYLTKIDGTFRLWWTDGDVVTSC